MNNGYIYVMLNMSMDGLVKIGRTNRDPKSREKELSQATGVPTPFILVYQEFFIDCIAAEHHIHEKLEVYRVSNKREFFSLPVYDAIKAIQQLKDLSPVFEKGEEIPLSTFPYERIEDDSNLGLSIIEKGLEYLHGSNGMLEDYNQALILFKKAERLGYSGAFLALGYAYNSGNGGKRNIVKAIEYYKKGSQAGISECDAEMAILFSSEESVLNLNNAHKCWDKYIRAIKNNEIGTYQFEYLVNFIMHTIQSGQNLNYMIHKEFILSFQDKIIAQFDIELDKVADNECEDPYTLYHLIKSAKGTFVQQLVQGS